MYIKKNFNFISIIKFTGGHIIWITAWATLVAFIWHEFKLDWLQIPWLPISIVATAVAFYIGFKNSNAYDRLWEARKIWGAIVNSSRMLGASVRGFIGNTFKDSDLPQEELDNIVKGFIHRHIAYLYILRSQLLVPTPWEHINAHPMVQRAVKRRKKAFGLGLYNDDRIEDTLHKYLGEEETERIIAYKNSATQLIDTQSQALQKARNENIIDDFRHMELQQILNDFYTHQGKAERIKKFPFPRQYGSTSFIFVGIFIFLLPFGVMGEFASLGHHGVWYSIPFTVVVSWIYVMMELVGDYSENPFEGLGNDIPMLSLCRVIEIDLLQMIDAEDIPKPIEAINDTLM